VSATLVALVSVLVTVGLFVITQVMLVRSAHRAARASMVENVLTALERVARMHSRPVFVRFWTKPEIEYALLIPRLLVGLRRRDRMIAVWAQTRVNAMLAAKTQGEVVVIASDLSGKISEWYLGQRSRGWFEQEVKDHQPKKNRTARRQFNTSAHAVLLVLLACGCAVLPSAVGSALADRWLSD